MIDRSPVRSADDTFEGLGRLLPPRSRDSSRSAVTVTAFKADLGWMVAGATDRTALFLEFADSNALEPRLETWRSLTSGELLAGENEVLMRLQHELDLYFSGQIQDFETPLELIGTPFQLSVWHALSAIPFGETISYGSLADSLGCTGAVRAVANANAGNRLAIVVPCHRVIGRNGKLTGYAGGLRRKRHLLDLEARVVGRPVQTDLF